MESVTVNMSACSKTRNVTVSMVSDYEMMAGHVKVGTILSSYIILRYRAEYTYVVLYVLNRYQWVQRKQTAMCVRMSELARLVPLPVPGWIPARRERVSGCERVSIEQWPRPLPGHVHQHYRCVCVHVCTLARHTTSCWRSLLCQCGYGVCVRGMFTRVCECPGPGPLCLSRQHATRCGLEDMWIQHGAAGVTESHLATYIHYMQHSLIINIHKYMHILYTGEII